MIVESQIRYQIARVLAKQLALKDFEDWFTQQSWNVHQSGDSHLQDLVGEIELRLAEYSSGHLAESDLLDELRPFATNCVMPISFGPSAISQGPLTPSNNVTIVVDPQEMAFPVQIARFPAASESSGIEHEAVLG